MAQKLSELIDEVVDLTEHKVIQLTRMGSTGRPADDDRPWRVGWQTTEWPHVAMRAGATIEDALKAAKIRLLADREVADA